MSGLYVVDASVTAKLFVEEPDSPKAWQLFWHLADPDPVFLFAPDLLYIECANILWKYTQRFGYDSKLAQQNLEALAELEIETVPTSELFLKAYQIAEGFGITAYDACYVALAQGLDCPLVTVDKQLATKIPKQTCEILML